MRIVRIKQEPVYKQDTEADLGLMDDLLSKYRDNPGGLIPLLQGTQELYGYIPGKAFNLISQSTGVNIADIYGVATFYAQFRLRPVGKNIIRVCHGTACHVQNATAITDAISNELNIKSGETTDDMMFTLESVACLGCCSLAPVMMIGEESYGKLDGKEAAKVVKKMKRAIPATAKTDINNQKIASDEKN